MEDDPYKTELLQEALRANFVAPEIVVARSVQQAVDRLAAAAYDLIVLDMSLPSHEIRAGGAQPLSQPSGGIELLLELSYDGRGDRVVIVTQYPDIVFKGELHPLAKFRKALGKEVKVNLAGAIYFNATDDSWRKQLKETLT